MAREHLLDRGTAGLCRIAQFGFWLVMALSFSFSSFLLFVTILEEGFFLINWCQTGHINLEISSTLKVLEDLFLAPLPFIIGFTLYNWSLQLGSGSGAAAGGNSSPEQHEGKKNPLRSFVTTKGLVIGLMISAVGVDLVEMFLQHKDDTNHYLVGAGLIIVLSIFFAVLQHETP